MPKKTSPFYVGRRRVGDYQIGTGGPDFWDPKVGFAFIKFQGSITRDVAIRLLGVSLKPGELAKIKAVGAKVEVVRKGDQHVE